MRKSKHKLTILLCLLLVVLIGVGAFLFVQLKNTKERASSLDGELKRNTQEVYVAIKDIKAGETILAEGEQANVELQKIYTGLDSLNYIAEEDLGSVAIVDIAMDVPILNNMYTTREISTDARDYEIATAELMTNLEEHDYVDVRISLPTGEDYLVLSKKEVNHLHLNESVFTTQLSELEILRLNSAIMDVYTHKGARMYITEYIEKNIQDEGDITYPVLTSAASLSSTDTNVNASELSEAIDSLNTTARLALETRLEGIKEDDETNITTGRDNDKSRIDTIKEDAKQKQEELEEAGEE